MTDSRWLPVLRAAFLAAVLAFAWLGLRGRLDEVGAALRATSPAGVAGALALVLVGLSTTGLVWLRLMADLGARLPVREGLSTFFVGQLGKYIPGSVWSIGAQAQLARRRAVPARTTVTAGLLFLGVHVVTAVLLGSTTLLLGRLSAPWPTWLSVLALLGAAVTLLTALLRHTAVTAAALLLMAGAWSAYAGALVLLTPGRPWGDVVPLAGAFALAYAVGVVVIFAPAGVGARETLFVLLLTPLLGVAPATALALLARVVHTVADGAVAGAWWWAARRGDRPNARPVSSGRLERLAPEGDA